MREGVNPEKYKSGLNKSYFHRIIIPVYIPETDDTYFSESLEIFRKTLNSIERTVNPEITAVSIIDNHSSGVVKELINSYCERGVVDKLVTYSENRGKVYAAVSEARACYEPFVTIADADVLFFKGWENAVFQVFKEHPKAGVVSPVPSQNLGLYYTSSVFFDNFWKRNIGYDKVVSDRDCEFFIRGMGNPALLKRDKNKYNWKEKQYYLKGDTKAIIGAGHFVATYKRGLFNQNSGFPEKKFDIGYEQSFLDKLADKAGTYRLSTPKTYAYHMGNKMDEFIREYQGSGEILRNIPCVCNSLPKLNTPYSLRSAFFKTMKKLIKF
ncbi:glycosyltransferase family A protein [Salegentibacter chungangensis]|uniref:Glycosyltransferase family A protein n=1 Tax=Salegentibacter chungangensis TaxID=1335724 RepID=A0ABW3NQN1_9FLAO